MAVLTLSRTRTAGTRAVQQRERERDERLGREPQQMQQAHELTKLRAAHEAAAGETARERDFASVETEKGRQFAAVERREAFRRATEFITPFLQDTEGVGDTGLSSAQTALETSITERGSQAQGRLSSLLAKRGIFRSGAGASAAATLEGETEAGVAQSRATFAESAEERRRRERESRRQTALSAVQAAGGGFN